MDKPALIEHLAGGHRIALDPEKHIYYVDGIPKPGVNEIMRIVGLNKDWSGVDTFYRDRGTAVHKAINLHLMGTLDPDSVDPVVVKPYLDQFIAWHKANPSAGLIFSERPLYSEAGDFCGTVDLIMDGVIWDFKCSKKLDREGERQYKRVGAGYRSLVRDAIGATLPFKLMLLTGEGPAKILSWECPFELWDAVLTLYRHC